MEMNVTRWTLTLVLLFGLYSCGSTDDANNDAGSDTTALDQTQTSDSCTEDLAFDLVEDIDLGPRDYHGWGPYAVGHTKITVEDTARSRSFAVEIWYPADPALKADMEPGLPMKSLLVDGAKLTALGPVLDAAPAECTTQLVHAIRDAAPSGSKWPLVLYSHGTNCARFANVTSAERLASHGIAVAAPDHEGGTIFDRINGDTATLGEEFLDIRAEDIRTTTTVLLDADDDTVPEPLRGKFDSSKVGIFAHSFGAGSMGLVLTRDPRFIAAMSHAAPINQQISDEVDLTKTNAKVALLIAQEDHMMTKLGNMLAHNDFLQMPGDGWYIEVKDAGHFSFMDFCKLDDGFADCCGDAERITQAGEPFEYIPQPDGLELAAFYTVAFFSATLLDDEEAAAAITQDSNQWTDIEVK